MPPCHEAAVLQPVEWGKEHLHHRPQALARAEHPMCGSHRAGARAQGLAALADTLLNLVPISREGALTTPKGGIGELYRRV